MVKCKFKIGRTTFDLLCEIKSNEVFKEKPGEQFKELEIPDVDRAIESSVSTKKTKEVEKDVVLPNLTKKKRIPLSKSFESLTIKDNVTWQQGKSFENMEKTLKTFVGDYHKDNQKVNFLFYFLFAFYELFFQVELEYKRNKR